MKKASVAVLSMLMSLTLSGCASLVIKREDNAGKITGKVFTRIILGAATFGLSEFQIAEHRILYKCRIGVYDNDECQRALDAHYRLGAAIAAGLQQAGNNMQEQAERQRNQQQYYQQAQFAQANNLPARRGTVPAQPAVNYLGNLNRNQYDPNSVSNPYGQYGSPYSPTSINNPYSQYGSPASANSIANPYTVGE